MVVSSFNVIIIMNNQVTVATTASSLPCRVAATPRCLHFLLSQSHWIFLIFGYRIMFRPFTFLDDKALPVIFYYRICVLLDLSVIFILCIIVIVSVHFHCHVSFIGYYNIRIIIHSNNCPIKEILV
ncbi:hypothetical protein AMTRI_Chr09g36340 [Amborella trichopoda]